MSLSKRTLEHIETILRGEMGDAPMAIKEAAKILNARPILSTVSLLTAIEVEVGPQGSPFTHTSHLILMAPILPTSARV